MARDPLAETQDHEELEAEARKHLDDEQASYLALISSLKALLEEYSRSRDGELAIYRVTTRIDYPPSTSLLKSARSISDKIVKKREGCVVFRV